jgi:GNAT acetyltransferase-like protein
LVDDPLSGAPVPRPLAAGETECANSIFQQPWWLEAVAPGRWGEVTCEHDGRVAARLPYAVRGRAPFRLLTQSSLTQTLGPWVEASDAKPARALAREHELLTELERRLPPAQAFLQQFSPVMLNALPFHWAGYHLALHYTYRLEGIGSEEAIWDGMRDNVRREIRKARKRVEVVQDLGVDRFHDVLSKTYVRQNLPTPHSLAELERLEAACARHGAGPMLFARDDAGRIHAVAWAVGDRSAAYYLLAGGEPDLRTSGASSLLVWEAILRARAVTDVFDFHGSMLKPVERFFRAFGSRQTPYLSVSRMSTASRLFLAARPALQRIARRP